MDGPSPGRAALAEYRGADLLSSIRALPLAASIGVDDPLASLFGSAEIALRADETFTKFMLARYRYFSLFFEWSCARFSQILLVGSGFDTRSLSSAACALFKPLVVEIDRDEVFARKRAVLAQQGVPIPDHVKYLAADLGGEDLVPVLKGAGFDPSLPAAVLAEGVLYFLPERITRRFLSPGFFDLAAGSVLLADLWADALVELRNGMIQHRPFHRSSLPKNIARWPAHLRAAGFADAAMNPLRDIAGAVWNENFDAVRGWEIVELRS